MEVIELRVIDQAKQLLEWNKEKLNRHAHFEIEELSPIFADEFIVLANGRRYEANHQNYFEFLNQFRSDIEAIEYVVQEYVCMDQTVVMPLVATVERPSGKRDVYEAILLVKFNDRKEIYHWQEVYIQT